MTRKRNKEQENAYNKKYRELNKEKVLTRQKEWRARNKERIRLYNEEYREANPERIKKNSKDWWEANKGKPCSAAATLRKKKWRDNNPEKLVTKRKERKNLNRIRLREYKSTLVCARCPENRPATLHFHHLDPSIKTTQVSEMLSRTWKRVMAEIDKCIVLCANCHAVEHDEA